MNSWIKIWRELTKFVELRWTGTNSKTKSKQTQEDRSRDCLEIDKSLSNSYRQKTNFSLTWNSKSNSKQTLVHSNEIRRTLIKLFVIELIRSPTRSTAILHVHGVISSLHFKYTQIFEVFKYLCARSRGESYTIHSLMSWTLQNLSITIHKRTVNHLYMVVFKVLKPMNIWWTSTKFKRAPNGNVTL